MALDDETPVAPDAEAEADVEAQRHKELRTITDARTMRALAHPVRIAIVEALSLGGAMTATEVGERIDESPTTCSFHLRQLAKYGFVEEAGGGKGRARPWRIVTLGVNIPATLEDPEADIAANVLGRVTRERQIARYLTWHDTKSSYSAQWRDAAISNEYIFYLTARELEQLQSEMHDVLMRWFDEGRRITDPSLRPHGSVPVELLLMGYPMEPPKPGSGDGPSPSSSSPGEAGDAEEDEQ
jgi:DNA-binding transcriptional ArsR family regulator